MSSWRNVENYTKDTLFQDFQGAGSFSSQEFIDRGYRQYSLKKTTCQQKLWRGVREGILKKLDNRCYLLVSGWRNFDNYRRETLIEDFRAYLFFYWGNFWQRGKLKYGLKKSTCRQKLWWAQRKGWVKKTGDVYYCV